MKSQLIPLFLLLATIIQFSSGNGTTPTLHEELVDLQRHVPMRRIQERFVIRLVQDVKFREALEFVRSAEFADTWNRFLEVPKVKEVLVYMGSAGLHIDEVLRMFAAFTGMQQPRVMAKREIALRNLGLSAFIDEVAEASASSDLVKAHEAKKRTNPEYRKLAETLGDPKFLSSLRAAFDDAEVKRLQARLEPYGIEFHRLWDLLLLYFGWSVFF